MLQLMNEELYDLRVVDTVCLTPHGFNLFVFLYLKWCILLHSWVSYIVEDRVLQKLLRSVPEERIELQHLVYYLADLSVRARVLQLQLQPAQLVLVLVHQTVVRRLHNKRKILLRLTTQDAQDLS